MHIVKAVAAFIVGYLVTKFLLFIFQRVTGLYELNSIYQTVSFVLPVVVAVYAARRFYSPAPITLAGDFGKPYVSPYPPVSTKSTYWADADEIKAVLNPVEGPHSQLNVGGGFLWAGQGNILTVGGSRGGKGVNLILPALLDGALKWDNAPSFIVLDPKGENCAVSAAYLKSIDYDVHVINPFEIEEIAQFGQARINPFDLFTATDKDYSKKVSAIVLALIPVNTKTDSSWDDAGRDLLGAYIGHMMTQDDEPKTFITLFNWMAYSGEKRDKLLTAMSENMKLGGTISTEANKIVGYLEDDAGKMVAGIYKAANNGLSVFSDLQLRHTISGSDFTLETLTKRETAIFVCVNPADLRRVSAWVRIVFNSLLDGLTKTYSKTRKTVLLMDEFPTIGKLQSFENNFAFLPGYNVTLWPVVQDLNQLKTLYPDSWETFVGSAQIKHWLATGDNFTADYVSARTPKVRDYRDEKEKSGQLKPLLEPWDVRQEKDIIAEFKGYEKMMILKKYPYYDQTKNGADNPFR